MVLLEAMASRVPIIASKVNAQSSTISGSAIVVDPTAEGIASGIEEFASMSAAEVEAMVDRSFQKVNLLSWGTIINSYIDLYSETLGS
jgi:glycosyltransferase involved in cell wall biosynthesis